MSYTEFHKGKLKVLTRNNKETLDYIEKNNLQDIIKECGWCDEIDFDVVSENSQYIILHKDGVYYGDDCEHMLCEYIEHETQEGGGDYYADVKRIGEDDYEFTLIFGNGGTCEEEILSEEISKLEKETWNPNKVEFEWKPASEIPTEHWENNYAISPKYLVKCGSVNGLSILGYASYSYATNSWVDCFQATETGIWKVIEWTDVKI